MAMKRCKANLHFYDTDTHKDGCPYCRHAELESDDLDMIVDYFPDTKEESFEPVVGWLVCTEGPNKGIDYKICARSNSNFISGVQGKNISIVSGDDSISRDQHAEILYDQDDNTFSLIRKTSLVVKVGNKKVKISEDLKAYDEITLGTSKFLFMPLCGEHFKWSFYETNIEKKTMAMKRCKANLHFYEANKNKDGCPYCRNLNDNVSKRRN